MDPVVKLGVMHSYSLVNTPLLQSLNGRPKINKDSDRFYRTRADLTDATIIAFLSLRATWRLQEVMWTDTSLAV